MFAALQMCSFSRIRRVAVPLIGHPPGFMIGWRCVSSNVRRRRRAYRLAEADPHTSLSRLKRLRERSTTPSHDLLRHLAENKIGKAMTTADRRALWFDLQHRRYAPLFLGQVKPRMRFWTAALEETQLPLPRLPEVAVAGRSNSGKSTLVNYLCGRHSAKVKREPGSTTELVFWQIGRPAQLCLVDLPGYGFATAPEERRLQWTEFTLWYVRSRRNLRRVLLLVDARQGLKPADKEMISYLERHCVMWQIVVTKCDKVVPKEIARRLTVLREDTSAYRKMAGEPIPVSALKRKGMQKLRETLDHLKVMKEVVKDGIKRRVYDLLELRRLRRAERARRRREANRADSKQEPKAPAVSATPGGHGADSEEGDGQYRHSSITFSDGDLHGLLDDWALHRTAAKDQGKGAAPKPPVHGAHYVLDDRDSRRVDGFVHSLFPELPSCSLPQGLPAASSDEPQRPAACSRVCPHSYDRAGKSSSATGSAMEMASGAEYAGDTSDSDSDTEIVAAMPPVLRFDPLPAHARDRLEALQHTDVVGTPSPFPSVGLANQPEAPSTCRVSGISAHGMSSSAPGTLLGEGSTVRLRQDSTCPPRSKDRIYAEDDFASVEDLASAKRRFAPPSPTPETSGRILADARRQYEREWAMELESVEEARASATDVGTGIHAVAAQEPETLNVQFKKQGRDGLGRHGSHHACGSLIAHPYIGKNGSKPIPKGIGRWRILGRPPARILKKQQQPDVAKVFGLARKQRRRRNLGRGLTWAEAKEKWMHWYHKNKRFNFDKVQMAESPRKEDVEAAFDERKTRLQRTSRSGRRQAPRSRDEAAEPSASS